MALSGKTSNLEIPYYLGTDKPPDMAAGTKAIADRVDAILSPSSSSGRLLIAQNTGAAAFKAMKGDATLAADGTLTIAAGAISRSKLAAAVMQTGRVATLVLAGGAVEAVTIGWGTEFADTNYTVAINANRLTGTSTNGPTVQTVEKTKSQIKVGIKNLASEGMSWMLEAIAVHD